MYLLLYSDNIFSVLLKRTYNRSWLIILRGNRKYLSFLSEIHLLSFRNTVKVGFLSESKCVFTQKSAQKALTKIDENINEN